MTQLIIHLFQSRPENESPHWRFHIITVTIKAIHEMLDAWTQVAPSYFILKNEFCIAIFYFLT